MTYDTLITTAQRHLLFTSVKARVLTRQHLVTCLLEDLVDDLTSQVGIRQDSFVDVVRQCRSYLLIGEVHVRYGEGDEESRRMNLKLADRDDDKSGGKTTHGLANLLLRPVHSKARR